MDKHEHITPGAQAITIISCRPGGMAEEVIRTIASLGQDNSNIRRQFGEWNDGQCHGTVTFMHDQKEISNPRQVTLKIIPLGRSLEGLRLTDSNRRGFSTKNFGREFEIEIGSPKSRSANGATTGDESADRLKRMAANAVIACWVVHGFGWTDRAGMRVEWPYGYDPRRPRETNFKTIDGSTLNWTVGQFITHEGWRSAHPGEWVASQAPYTFIPAALGMNLVLHEYMMHAHDDQGYSITTAGGHRISNDDHIWGGYARWSTRELYPEAPDWMQELALTASSPFAFHVAVARRLFPKSSLASALMLERIGKHRLIEMLTRMADAYPERFYRLIDEDGVTHRLEEVGAGKIVYEGGLKFSIADIVENFMTSTHQLAEIQEDPARELPRITRVIPDSYFYVVMFALACNDGRGHNHLGGNDMYDYMLNGGVAMSHEIINNRLFELLKDLFGIQKLEFRIFSPLAVKHPTINQFTWQPARFRREHWLPKLLVR